MCSDPHTYRPVCKMLGAGVFLSQCLVVQVALCTHRMWDHLVSPRAGPAASVSSARVLVMPLLCLPGSEPKSLHGTAPSRDQDTAHPCPNPLRYFYRASQSPLPLPSFRTRSPAARPS